MAFPPFGDHSFLEIRHMSGSGFGDAVPRIRRVKDTLARIMHKALKKGLI